MEPDVNEVFRDLYSAATVAMSANGNQNKFRWKNNTAPFPYEEAAWSDVSAFGCGEGKSNLELMATTYQQNLGTEDFSEQVSKLRAAWESRGLKVRSVSSSKNNAEIATDLPNGSVVIYSAGLGGEAVEATAECFAGFAADPSTSQVFKGDKA